MPKHVGLIPDGNRRWAKERGLPASEGYGAGVVKGLEMLRDCIDIGIEEISLYGFTQDNNKRPKEQRIAFSAACVAFVEAAIDFDISLLVVGDSTSKMFPKDLIPYTERRIGRGPKVNMLVNYGWEWDLLSALNSGSKHPLDSLASREVSRIDMIIRWGGFRRLSGFLPLQSVYADFFVVDDYWPDYNLDQFYKALEWFQVQEATLGG